MFFFVSLLIVWSQMIPLLYSLQNFDALKLFILHLSASVIKRFSDYVTIFMIGVNYCLHNMEFTKYPFHHTFPHLIIEALPPLDSILYCQKRLKSYRRLHNSLSMMFFHHYHHIILFGGLCTQMHAILSSSLSPPFLLHYYSLTFFFRTLFEDLGEGSFPLQSPEKKCCYAHQTLPSWNQALSAQLTCKVSGLLKMSF